MCQAPGFVRVAAEFDTAKYVYSPFQIDQEASALPASPALRMQAPQNSTVIGQPAAAIASHQTQSWGAHGTRRDGQMTAANA